MKTLQFRWIIGLALLCLLNTNLSAQQEVSRPLVLSIFNNATLLPGAGKLGVWGTPVHPGISLGTEFLYSAHPRHDWFQTAKFAYHYHRYIQHSVQLMSELGYRYHFGSPLDLESRFGLGYLHSISAAQIFELNDGVYEQKTSLGRPQALASLSLGFGYQLPAANAPRVFLAYQFYMQFPFVNEYVPILPNTAVHLGLSFSFFHQKQGR